MVVHVSAGTQLEHSQFTSAVLSQRPFSNPTPKLLDSVYGGMPDPI